MDNEVQALIDLLGLKPLPVEGGLFSRSYLSEATIAGEHLPERYQGQAHHFGSAIFALMTPEPDSFSTMHRLLTDEVYHFYLGDPIEMLLLYPDGSSKHVLLGQEVLDGQYVQYTVPAGVWQGFRLRPGGRYALIGTTMAPGFHVTDFEAVDRASLIRRYPQEAEWITALTREQEAYTMKPGDEA